MNIKLRKVITKIKWLHELCINLVEFENERFYRRLNNKEHYDEKLKSMKNMASRKSCFIIGNGPSLTTDDLELIKDQDCFAANLIFRIFEKTNWRPKYFVIQDRYADTGNALDYMEVQYMFISEYYWRKRGMNNPHAVCIRARRNNLNKKISFSEDISDYIINMPTITYTMIQLAVYLGYDNIYLLGMDHSYALTYDEKGNVVQDDTVDSHFFTDKNPKDVIANIEGMNKAYIVARDYAKEHNVSIINVTRGGKLEWFPRMGLEEVLEANE